MCFKALPSARRRFRAQTKHPSQGSHVHTLVRAALISRSCAAGWGPALSLACARGRGGSEVLVPAPRNIKRGDAHLERLITAVSEQEETGSFANLLVEV